MSAPAMPPEIITSALATALTFAEKTGATEVTKKAAVDAYEYVKSLLVSRFGADSKPTQALSELEQDPASEGCRLLLKERLAKVDADADPELAAAAHALLTAIRALPSGEQHIQKITGNYNAQAGRGGVAQVNIYGPRRSDD